MSTKRPRYTTAPQNCTNESCVEMNCTPTQPASCKSFPDLPLCEDVKFDFKCTPQNTTTNILKSIKIKRNAPQVIKEELNTPHNLALIGAALNSQTSQQTQQTQQTQIQQTYRINPTTNYNNILHSWLKLIMLHHIKHHVFARLANGQYGVQIIAVKIIPKDT